MKAAEDNGRTQGKLALAFDTSNYTSSAAWFGGVEGRNSSLPLPVGRGELGLRQSEALFWHVRRLPELICGRGRDFGRVGAGGASSKPREAEASYMPCFLAGASQARTIAELAGLPYYEFSHQQGHVAAAAWSSGRIELLDGPFLAWHLSGGTTELLYVRPSGRSISCEKIGGTTDLSAGQLVDRTGRRLGLPFPAGGQLDALASGAEKKNFFKVRVNGTEFSLSGVENKISALNEGPEEAAYYALATIAGAVGRATIKARGRYGPLPVLYSGGVASSAVLRGSLEGYFARPEHSSDNALGTAILTYRRL